MFIRLNDGGYLNIDQVAEVRFDEDDSLSGNAIIVMKNDRRRGAFISENQMDWLCSSVVAAPVGYFAQRAYDFDFDDEISVILWIPIVAFVVDSSQCPLAPITAEDGLLNRYAVRCPDGRIYTDREEFFASTPEYEDFIRRERAKIKIAQLSD